LAGAEGAVAMAKRRTINGQISDLQKAKKVMAKLGVDVAFGLIGNIDDYVINDSCRMDDGVAWYYREYVVVMDSGQNYRFYDSYNESDGLRDDGEHEYYWDRIVRNIQFKPIKREKLPKEKRAAYDFVVSCGCFSELDG